MSIKYFFKKYISFFLISLFLVASCKDDEINNPLENPPEMPPVSSMKMDFNVFPSQQLLPKISDSDTSSFSNWFFASIKATAWHTLLSVGMSIPVSAFTASFNYDAEQLEDGRWLWSYEFTPLGGIKHTASLYGEVSTAGVVWEMYITKAGVYDNFLWFSGESDLLATEGTWTINAEPNNPTPWIGIEWERNTSDSTGNIKFTNIVPNGNENGGYIYFGTTTNDDYNAFYEIYNRGMDNLISIQWNRNTHTGRVMDENHFGDSEWHCWDENLTNIDCP